MTWMSTVERDLMENVAGALRDRLPATWRVEADLWQPPDPSLRARWRTPDFRLTIYPPNDRPIRLAVEVQLTVTPKKALQAGLLLRQQFTSSDGTVGMFDQVDGVILVSTFLSERARDLLGVAGIGYADSTGNARIAVDDPPLFIETSGLDRLPTADRFRSRFSNVSFIDPRDTNRFFRVDADRALRSLKGPGAALGIRALVDYQPPYGLRELAEKAGVSLGTLSRVLEFAEGEALVERTPRGPITGVDWVAFLRRWAKDYSLLDSNRTSLYLEPRGLDVVLERLRSYRGRYAVSGSQAAHTVAPEAPAVLAVIYIPSLAAADALNLKPTDSGGNVLLVQPFPSARGTQSLAPFLRTRSIDGVQYVALAQAAVDLLTSPGRGPSEAEALIDWMQVNEDAWRNA